MGAFNLALSEGKSVKLHDEARATHMHVLGVSGQGKSYFLEHMIRRDITAGNGVCVIDPHGELYDNLVRWIVSEGLDKVKTIHLLNPSDKEYTFGFNPLCVDNGVSLEYRVDAMVDACVKVWGGTDITQTPRLAKCLTAIFHALAENKLSLAEARNLTNTQLRSKAHAIVEGITNEEYKSLWQEFLGYNDRMFAEYFESSTSRLIRFVGNPIVRDIVGQTENLIDFKKCMDKGHIVLVNLAPKGVISKEVSRLLGALLTNDLYTTAFSRNVSRKKPKPFYCYIDECAQYLTEDIVNSLDETRKFGLHMVLSHQRLNQLKEHGENFFNAVMANAQIKVVFKVGDEDTADLMSRHLFRTSFDLELPKHSMDKPYTVDHEVAWFKSESHSISDITGEGEGSGTGAALGASLSQLHDSEGSPIGGYGLMESSSDSYFSSANRFGARAETKSRGVSEGLKPVIEILPTELYKIEELIHLGMVELLSLPPRTAYICGPGLAPAKVNTVSIKPGVLLPQFVPNRVRKINEKSAAVSSREHVRQQIRMRSENIGITGAKRSPVTAEDDDGLGF